MKCGTLFASFVVTIIFSRPSPSPISCAMCGVQVVDPHVVRSSRIGGQTRRNGWISLS